MAHAKRGFARTDRVKEQILRELAELIQNELKDPRVGFITLTDVEVTRDYSYATVYYTVLEEDKRQDTHQVLNKAKGFLRSQLSHRIEIYRTPELIFKYDESIERGLHISQLIDQADKL